MRRVEDEWHWIALCLYENGVESLVLEESTAMRVEPRHFADCGGGVVRVHPELEEQPISRIRGVLAHEAGHVLDREFDLFDEELDPERRADLLAFYLTGWTIYYDDELVQRAGPGARGTTPRPRGLR